MCPNPCVRIHVRKNAHNVSNHVLLMLMMLLLMTLLLLLLMTLLFVGHPKTLCGAWHSHRQSRPNLSLELPSHRWVHA